MSARVALSVSQFVGAWRLMCSQCAGQTMAAVPGIEYVFSGLPIAFWNLAFQTADDVSADDLRSLGGRACEWASGRGVPWLLVVTHDWLQPGVDAAVLLADSGLVPMMPLTGMRAEDVAPPDDVPDGLRLVKPSDDAGCAAVLDVNAAAYGMDLSAARAPFGRLAFWENQFASLGLVRQRPASCAAVFGVDGFRYVALVATSPGDQRRGYAEAVMRHALAQAAAVHGPRPTVLHATEAGRPVYSRMGYKTLAAHTVFIERRFLAGG